MSLLALGASAEESLAEFAQIVPAATAFATTKVAATNEPLVIGQIAQAQRVTANPTAASYQMLHVNPETGSNRASGTAVQPLKTITRALEVALPNTVIVLAPGRYTAASGEVFPLQLKPGVTIQGEPSSGDRTAIIEGGGQFTSSLRSRQNTAIIAADRAGIAQVAISNADGYGVWIESASPTILESAFVNNRQSGLYIASGSPRVQGSYFSGNRVAGVIVLGRSTALIHQNTFDNTGDAIRVLDGATPDIAANQITNNEAGLVVIGDAQPTLRDNRLSGNRRDDVVEVAASIRQPSPPVASAPLADQVVDQPPIEQQRTDSVAIAASPDEVFAEQAPGILPGAPGSALAAIASGLDSEVKSGRDADAPGSLLLNRRRRRRERNATQESRPGASISRPSPAVSVPANNNRLAVPSQSIPIGSGSSSIIFSPPSGGGSAPPAPPSRAQALGLYYRVFVAASDPFVQDDIRTIVPDAFRTRFEGQSMMQVGAFPTEEEAEARRRLLEENNYDALVEYIR
ncbi:DUF1565 domain-containing protein [cf. Phormidesmis sp. LEGE 11477]|uniref:DUF1565 domain-containing protein n=1 Tax=cf. Phormidesmis sp. LEGE 11477 TaxID=1828680 RepID=UPI00187E625C|nr:DUF1565 domain-containing protein [cf. Phormidesmis sp. LEGE 11477]